MKQFSLKLGESVNVSCYGGVFGSRAGEGSEYRGLPRLPPGSEETDIDVAAGQSRQNGVERKEQIVPPEQACGRIGAAQAPSAVYLPPELIWSGLL